MRQDLMNLLMIPRLNYLDMKLLDEIEIEWVVG